MKILNFIPKGQGPSRESVFDSLRLETNASFVFDRGISGTARIFSVEKIWHHECNQLWFLGFKFDHSSDLHWAYYSTHLRKGFTVDSNQKFYLDEFTQKDWQRAETPNDAVSNFHPLTEDEVTVLVHLAEISPDVVQMSILTRLYEGIKGNTIPCYTREIAGKREGIKRILLGSCNVPYKSYAITSICAIMQ